MVSFDEDSMPGLRAAFAEAKHAVRDFGFACVRAPLLPVYRFNTPAIPLPGDVRRIYCYHVRKTGGTTFAHAFLTLGGEEPGKVERRMKNPPFCTASGPYRFAYQDPPLLRRGYFFFGYGHKPAETLRLPGQTFTVTILRDPVDRVVSLYRYLADPRADEGHTFHSLDYEREWARDGFGRFLDQVSRRQLLNQLNMFSQSGSVPEAAGRILACDRVLTTEKLDDGLDELGSFLGLPLRAQRLRQSLFQYQPTDSEKARLRELLDPEYQMLELVTKALATRAPAADTASAPRGT
jgi:hypothetical protein